MEIFRKSLCAFWLCFARIVLRLRYKIEVRGADVLKDPRLKEAGVLVMPSHVAEIEPFIVSSILGKSLDLRPLVIENYYNYIFAWPFMKMFRAMRVPEFDQAVSEYKYKEAEKLFNNVVTSLDKNHHILLYPSGTLKVSGKDQVGGKSLAHATVQKAKNVEIILVRITGLWGSRFSKAHLGKSPDFWKEVTRGFFTILKNGIFFVAKRKVIIEIALADENFPKNGTRKEFNAALEQFYNNYPNADGTRSKVEPLSQVRYNPWSKNELLLEAKKPSGNALYQDLAVPKNVKQDILCQLSELSDKSVKEIKDEDDLLFDVGLDSLDIATLYTHLDSNYEIEMGVEPGDLVTVQDLYAVAMRMKKGKNSQESTDGERNTYWPKKRGTRPEPRLCETDTGTMIESFLRTADRMGNHPASTDAITGIMTYSNMKRAIIILARQIEKMEGDYIGVMLPSSNAVFLLLNAIQLAGKVPVPLNWTVGSYFMDHAIELMELKTIITSERFMQKLDNIAFGKALDKLVLIEDIKKNLRPADKIKGALLAKRGTHKILHSFPAVRKGENDVAIVMFTSGTTAMPKAIPLTHLNILSNQICAFDTIDLGLDDVLIMPLPAFHIFGANIGCLFLLFGVRVVFTPDPLDASTIGKEILKWRATVIVLAPTFYSNLFRAVNLSQLKSLRIFLSGAEKAPPSLMDYIRKLGDVWFLEGYGLTETSPIITANGVYSRPRGVGKVVPCVQVSIINVESGKVVGPHQIGEVCVTGVSVFSGYYKQDNTDVFLEMDGKKWFKTGDIGHLDEDNYLYLQGRLKLSFKRAGEMINVVAIEVALFNRAKELGWISQDELKTPFACVPKKMPQGSTKVVLFSEIDIALDKVNKALFEIGFARLYKINEIILIDEIPLLKSGKTCYRNLFAQLKEQSPTKT